MLSGKTVTVGVTGGIAAYKACELVSLLKKAGADVHVVLTAHAAHFVTPLTLETLSGNRAVTDMFDPVNEWEIGHISLAKRSDMFVVAPATANIVGKLACGIADDFLSTTLMATRAPVLLAPAMNTGMLTSAAYRANEQTLKDRGYLFVAAGTGRLACGDDGKGRMAEPKEIFEKIVSVLTAPQDYAHKTVLVTSGGTREPIDPVRYIGNRSSGKMGAAIAQAAYRRGARVIYVAAESAVLPATPAQVVRVETTAQMLKAVLEHAQSADIIIKAAAPADYAPDRPAEQKIKEKDVTLHLCKNPDIAAAVGQMKGKRKLVVFAAETENLEENARAKLAAKNADMVVANNVLISGAGFDCDTNVATLITKKKTVAVPQTTKAQLAERILDEIAKL